MAKLYFLPLMFKQLRHCITLNAGKKPHGPYVSLAGPATSIIEKESTMLLIVMNRMNSLNTFT